MYGLWSLILKYLIKKKLRWGTISHFLTEFLLKIFAACFLPIARSLCDFFILYSFRVFSSTSLIQSFHSKKGLLSYFTSLKSCSWYLLLWLAWISISFLLWGCGRRFERYVMLKNSSSPPLCLAVRRYVRRGVSLRSLSSNSNIASVTLPCLEDSFVFVAWWIG